MALRPVAEKWLEARVNETDLAGLEIERSDSNQLVIRLSGVWRLHHGMPTANRLKPQLISSPRPSHVTVEASRLRAWDSSLVNFLAGLTRICNAHQILLDRASLPEGLNRLVELATSAPELKEPRATTTETLLTRAGRTVLARLEGFATYVDFVGLVALALGNALRGRARFRKIDLLEVLQASGADALGIVTLISYLVGIIMAFMGAVQLQQFGAAIYVADLVAIATVREMGAMMTGVIMSGRTGAAFAAQLGSMKVTQEIDALATMGISPIEFLVVPRVLGLVLMMPLLCLYADFVGILGGATVGVTMLGLTLNSYMQQTIGAIWVSSLVGGLVKSVAYGVLIAIAGCYQGFECGQSSSAVGEAATAAVVNGIVMIVVACGLFAVIFNLLGF